MSNTGFTGKDNFQWWIGQVAVNQLEDRYNPDGFDRVRVRIVGIHDKSGSKLPDSKLPWAMVERPTTQGSFNRSTTGLAGGEWVRGYFLDAYNQVPVITAILTRSESGEIIDLDEVKQKGSTEFKNVVSYNFGFNPPSHKILGGAKPTEPAIPSQEDFNKAKNSQVEPAVPTVLPGGTYTGPGDTSITLKELNDIRSSKLPYITSQTISDAESDAIRAGIIGINDRTV
jgi:hypothetical protein